MSLIFDSFPDLHQAEAFAAQHNGKVFGSQYDSNKVDIYPYALIPPIVLVNRQATTRDETAIINMVVGYGGKFAGT